MEVVVWEDAAFDCKLPFVRVRGSILRILTARIAILSLLLAAMLPIRGLTIEPDDKRDLSRSVVWAIDSIASIGGAKATALGSPSLREGSDKAVCFNGVDDAILLPMNPIAGWSQFTIQVRIKPAADGPPEQRFLHLQDSGGTARALLELRMDKAGRWYLDGFLASASGKLALVDPEKKHPAGEWYWVALVFDGAKMSILVNSEKEKEAGLEFPPMLPGETSIGVRLNRVSWFKGCIAEIRFDPTALAADALQRPGG